MSPITDHEKMATSGHKEETLHALRLSIREKAKNSVVSSDSDEGDLQVPLSWMKVKDEEGGVQNIDVVLKKKSSSSSSRARAMASSRASAMASSRVRPLINGKRKPKLRSMVEVYKTAKHCTLEELELRNGRPWPPTEEDEAEVELEVEVELHDDLSNKEGSSGSDPTLQSMLERVGGKWSGAKRTIMSCSKKRKHVETDEQEKEEEDLSFDDDVVLLTALEKLSKGKRRRKLVIAESQISDHDQEHGQPGDDQIVDSLNSKRVETENPHIQTEMPAENEAVVIADIAGPSAATTTTTTTVIRLMGTNIVVINNTI